MGRIKIRNVRIKKMWLNLLVYSWVRGQRPRRQEQNVGKRELGGEWKMRDAGEKQKAEIQRQKATGLMHPGVKQKGMEGGESTVRKSRRIQSQARKGRNGKRLLLGGEGRMRRNSAIQSQARKSRHGTRTLL